MLTTQQLDAFRKDGVLLLKDFFFPQEVERWRSQVLAHMGHPVSGADWWTALRKHPTSDFRPADGPAPESHRRLRELYACFQNSAVWEGGYQLAIRPPEPEAPWSGARTPHLDFPISRNPLILLNNVLYLSDVEPFGAPFMYWPGSHHIAWTYFQEHPEDYRAQGAYSQDRVFEKMMDRISGAPVAFTGTAGDLLLWHSLLMHSASVNKSESARLALFGRWGSPLPPGAVDFDFRQDPWQAWALNSSAVGSTSYD